MKQKKSAAAAGLDAIRAAACVLLITLCSTPVFSQSGVDGYRYPPELVPIAGAAPEKLLPEDEKIGALNDASSLSGEAVRILEKAEQFIESLRTGRPDEKLLEPQSRRALLRFLGVSFDESISIENVRYSEVKTGYKTEEERSASVELRVFSEYGDTSGELLFLWREEEWYITAVHIDFNALKNITETEDF